MTETTQDSYALTANDIKAMRTCDSIVYRYDLHQKTSRLEVNKEADKKCIWRQSIEIPVETTTDVYPYNEYVYAACAVMYTYSWLEDELATVIGMLKPGDILSVHLVAGNNNALLDKAELKRDTLSIRITRKGKRMLFRVYEQISTPQPWARLCRTAPKSEE